MKFKSFIRCQNCTFGDKRDLFKIINLVYGEREIVRSLYNSLQGHAVYGGYSELAGSLFVSIKMDGWENFWNHLHCKLWQLLYILNLARKIYNIRQAWTLKENSKTCERVHTDDDNETTLHKWEPMELKYSKFLL